MNRDREYICLPKSSVLPDSSFQKRKLDNFFWVNLVHFHLLKFYKEYEIDDLKKLIEIEKKKISRKHIEDVIKDYIYSWFEKSNKRIFREGIIINLEPKVKYDQVGFYDIKFQHSDWVDSKNESFKYYSVECKNLTLDATKNHIAEYVFVNHKKDGGVYRYFNGKYAQNQNFGGMLGFILDGEVNTIKEKIIEKLKSPFDITPQGDLIDNGIILNSIEGNDFTFNSTHKRNDENFTLHHFLFDFK
jgi:hypothetical protein